MPPTFSSEIKCYANQYIKTILKTHEIMSFAEFLVTTAFQE